MNVFGLHRRASAPELPRSATLGAVAVIGDHFGYSARRAANGDPFEGHAVDLPEPRDVYMAGG